MKLFQPQATCMYGKKIYTSNPDGYPSLKYPNGGGYCYHDFIEIEFFREGQGIHFMNAIPYQVRSGYFYLLMPGDYHYYQLDETAYFHLYNIKIDAQYPSGDIIDQLQKFPRPYAVYLEGEEYENVLREVTLLHQYCTKSPRDEIMIKNIGERVILLLIQNLKQMTPGEHDQFPQPIRLMIDYVNKHYKEEITAEKMAELTGLTAHYFSSYFKAHTGQSFCDYVNRIRMFHAAELLDSTYLSVKEISSKVGFRSQAYFTRLFVRYFEVSPTEYRKKNREK